MYTKIKNIFRRPKIWSKYTAEKLWNDNHISKKMLEFHLNEDLEPASRNKRFIDKSAVWIISHFKLNKDSSVCDFGCGPGLYTSRFAKAGAFVTGIDFSKRSIRYAKDIAKKSKLKIEYINQNYLEFETNKRFDLITLIYCDFCPLNPKQRKKLLRIFYKNLKDDGCVLLDVFSLDAFKQREEAAIFEHNLHNGFWSANDYYGVQNSFKYNSEKAFLDKYTIFEKSKTWEVFNWLQYYSLNSIKNEFKNNGFKIIEYFSDVAGAKYKKGSPEIAVVAAKI